MKKYLTNKIFPFGMGSRMNFLINIIGLTDLLKTKGHNVEFVLTPFSYEGFGVNFSFNQVYPNGDFKNGWYSDNVVEGIPKTSRDQYLAYCNRWDKMINFKGLTVTEVNHKELEIIPYPYTYYLPQQISNQEIQNHTFSIKDKIKDKLSLPTKKESEKINVCVHVRRNDVSESFSERYLDDTHYREIIDLIRKVLEGHKYTITIHTQRKNFNENLYSDCNIIYDDDMLESEAWLDLVNSDILVISKSAFSYSSALLNDGVVFSPNNEGLHDEVDGWFYDKEMFKNEIIKKYINK